jgi:hypothetical protein
MWHIEVRKVMATIADLPMTVLMTLTVVPKHRAMKTNEGVPV